MFRTKNLSSFIVDPSLLVYVYPTHTHKFGYVICMKTINDFELKSIYFQSIINLPSFPLFP